MAAFFIIIQTWGSVHILFISNSKTFYIKNKL